MCYLGVNTACALQSLLKAPGWRPSFRYFHWILSTIGAFLCIIIMFVSAWYFALLAIFIGAGVYKYIEYAGAEKEWGDGLKGLGLSAARFALLNVDDSGQTHTRNWRPQLLVLSPTEKSFSENVTPADAQQGLLSFVSQLKAGKGLTMVVECIEGSFVQKAEESKARRLTLSTEIKKFRIRGFCDTLVNEDYLNGISYLIQTSGLGGLRHNTVMIPWPDQWSVTKSYDDAHNFVEIVRNVVAAKCAILVPKNVHVFPRSNEKVFIFTTNIIVIVKHKMNTKF